jgi:hypothetical protein
MTATVSVFQFQEGGLVGRDSPLGSQKRSTRASAAASAATRDRPTIAARVPPARSEMVTTPITQTSDLLAPIFKSTTRT